MITREKSGNPLCVFAFLVVLTILFSCLAAPAVCYELLIGTDGPGEFSHYAGKAVCRAISRNNPGVTCRTVAGENYTDSLTNVQSGSLDLALVNSKMIYDAFHSAGYFQYIDIDYDALRLLMPLYREPVTLVSAAKEAIFTIDDLPGKRINGGAPTSLHDLVLKDLLLASDWKEKDFAVYLNLSPANSQDYLALLTGSIQAMLHIGMHPDRKLENRFQNRTARLVGIDSPAVTTLITSQSGYRRCTIAPKTYENQQEKISTLALETYLITSADTDAETVNMILSAIYSAKERLQQAHPAFLERRTSVEVLNEGYLHPHPEAILFFQTNRQRL